MSEINSIANGTFTIGQTSATNFQAGPGISITQPSEGTVRIANDETVLFDNGTSGTSAGSLSENKTNFDYLKVYVGINGGYSSLDGVSILNLPANENVSATWLEYCFGGGANAYMAVARLEWTSQNTFQINQGTSLQRPVGTTAVNGNTSYNDQIRKCVSRIVGVNRKEV